MPPDSVGNQRRVLVSDQAGKANLIAELKRIGIMVDRDDPRLDSLLGEVKEREAQGYAYDGADASFGLLARRMFGGVPQFFEVESYKVMVEQRHNALGELVTISEAVVKVVVDGARFLSVGEGNGPINALDQALRKDLGRYQHLIEDLELADYKVRILNGGTAATTGADRKPRRHWGALVHGRRVAEHRRCEFSGVVRLDHLEAAEGKSE